MPAVAICPPQQARTDPDAREFEAMREAYRASGGIAHGDDLARLLTDRQCGDFASLAVLILAREVFAFQWRKTFWVPMFQFNLHDLTVRASPHVSQVLAELADEYDGWDLAVWFARPNQWLQGARPVDRLNSNFAQVLEAARTDRFIAAG
jgi:hypothetical protein